MSKSLSIGTIAILALAPAAFGTPNGSAATEDKSAWQRCEAPVKPAKESGVPNFGKLNSFVWRSGQPTKEGYRQLATEGIKTVVNLREEFPQDKDLLPAGVNYVYIPIKDDHAPTMDQAKQFIDVVTNPDNWPVLVHCKGGEGRAGTMAALVRHSFDGWDNAKIMQEVGNFRLKYLGFIKTGMASCQKKFIEEWNQTPALTPQRPGAKPADIALADKPKADAVQAAPKP